MADFANPFRPGAGHMPPFLAGREEETEEFLRLLDQSPILENLILTGLRGVGKTVLLDTFKPLGLRAGWLWVGTDLTESAAVSEEHLATRLITDLSVATSGMQIGAQPSTPIGFDRPPETEAITLDFMTLTSIYKNTPGLVIDKLKAVLDIVWRGVRLTNHKGIVFAYDEAQTLARRGEAEGAALSLLLDLFQSVQKKGIPFMLVLSGLPTLFPKMVEARTFAERMCRVVVLGRLSEEQSHDAIVRPILDTEGSVQFTEESVKTITRVSAGYPYFIQFICRESFDAFLQGTRDVPIEGIVGKLDSDFFSGRWARAADRQRQLLYVAAQLDSCDGEFSVQELVEKSLEVLTKPFGSSHVNQMLGALSNHGLIYKNRYGKYSFAVPLLWDFIRRNGDLLEGLRHLEDDAQIPLLET